MPANATFATARAATIQAAQDLYGGNSAVERAAGPGVDGRRRELS